MDPLEVNFLFKHGDFPASHGYHGWIKNVWLNSLGKKNRCQKKNKYSWWLNQPLWTILVKIGSSPPNREWTFQKYFSCHHFANLWQVWSCLGSSNLPNFCRSITPFHRQKSPLEEVPSLQLPWENLETLHWWWRNCTNRWWFQLNPSWTILL